MKSHNPSHLMKGSSCWKQALCLLILGLPATSGAAFLPAERLSRLDISATTCSLGDGPGCGNVTEQETTFDSIDPLANQFDEPLGGASQASSFSAGTINAATQAIPGSVFSEFGGSRALSVFSLGFHVAAETSVRLTGSIMRGGFGRSNTYGLVSLSGPGIMLELSTSALPGPGDQPTSGDFDVREKLQPGRYMFLVESNAAASSIEFQTASAEAALSVVPVPAPWVLLGTALMILAARRTSGSRRTVTR